MFENFPDTHQVSFDGDFQLAQAATAPIGEKNIDEARQKKRLKKAALDLYDLQRILYAHNQYSVLLVFQAMDAAGKDSTIGHVLRQVNPAGCQIYSFKNPSSEELEHDFLWRTAKSLPERGRIGVFNRSYYEEVLVAKVHQSIIEKQNLPETVDRETLWQDRYESIRDHEAHLARNGTVIIKFWLNVSKEEQKSRFLARLDTPEKHWKFSPYDIQERQHWSDYMNAYEEALNQTSRPWAPWYAIPADNKPYARATVARIIRSTLQNLGLHWPTVDSELKTCFDQYRQQLLDE